MAGGYKTWTAETFDAADFNQYIAGQMVMRFDTKAELLADVTSPETGMMAYYHDYRELVMWNGTSWVGVKPRTARQIASLNNNTTTYVNTDLTLPLEANSHYVAKIFLTYGSSEANDINFKWSFSGSFTSGSGLWTVLLWPYTLTQLEGPLTLASYSMTATDLPMGGNEGDILAAFARAKVDTSTAGTLTLRFARKVNVDGGACWFGFGSYMSLLKVK